MPGACYATNVIFTINVTNAGPDAATGVVVTDPLPGGFSYVSHVASQGTYVSGTGVWTIGALAVNQTVTLNITATVLVLGSHVNTAQVSASNVFDPDSTPNNNAALEDDQASATVTPCQVDPEISKDVDSTDQSFTSDPAVAIGETVVYAVTVTVHPGIFTSATIVDTLPQGLSYVECSSITSGALTTDVVGGFAAICGGETVTEYPIASVDPQDIGRQVTFNFGTLTNPTLSDQTLIIYYRVIVLDVPGNQDGTTLANSAVFNWDLGSVGPASTTVNVVEPDLAINKSAQPVFVTLGTEVTFTLIINHTALSNTNAYDTVVLDVLPPELEFVPGSLDCTFGAQDPDVDCSFDGVDTIRAEWSNFALGGGNSVIRFRAIVLSFPADLSIDNTAFVSWTSLPGDQSTPVTSNPFSHERFYDPGSLAPVYFTSDTISLLPLRNPTAIPSTGFAPGVVTDLSALSVTKYATTDMILEIPKIKLKVAIVGVPFVNGFWDINWLTGEVGWLEETALPGTSGNTVITSHITTSYGSPGPFARLKELTIGDHILLRANGMIYTYIVREMKKVNPDDLSVYKHEEKSWLTLVTCADYNLKTQTYDKRLIVRAELVEIKPISDTGR